MSGYDQLILGALLIALALVLGGAVGSFLNVVIYRLPRGLPLTRPPSACPACGARIRPYDNIPVLGWILLRGCCRDCRAPIAMRYPLVEATVALTLLALGIAELFTGGANLPVRKIDAVTGFSAVGWPHSDILAIMGYHFAMLCVLLCVALIESDGHELPARFASRCLLAALALGALLPGLRPAPWHYPVETVTVLPRWLAGGLDGIVGLAAGLGTGAVALAGAAVGQRLGRHLASHSPGVFRTATAPCLGASNLARTDSSPQASSGRSMVWMHGLVGCCLGWQAVLSIGLVSAALALTNGLHAARRPRLRRIPPTAYPAALAFVHIIWWKALFWPALLTVTFPLTSQTIR